MLHKFSAWTHLSNFDQSQHKNWTKSVTNAWSWRAKSKATVFPACNSWLNFRVRGQFEIKILIVRRINTTKSRLPAPDTTYFIWIKQRNKLEPAITWKQVPADNFKKYLTSMGRHLSPRYGQVILVSRYLVLTAVNWSQHWCPICVHYQFSCALKLARKYEIEHWSRSSKAINWSADSLQKSTSRRWVDTWDRDMVMWYWSVAILFWQLSIDHFVNVQYTRCGLAKTRLRHPSLPLDSLSYHTLTICRRVRTYVRSVNHVTTMSIRLCPTRASRGREPR